MYGGVDELVRALIGHDRIIDGFPRQKSALQHKADAAACGLNQQDGDLADMSDKPKFLSFQGEMYVKAELFVQPLLGQTFSGGTNRQSITRVRLSDGSWFEAGDLGYKAWPLGTELVKVGALGESPEPIKMKLDLDVSEALEKIASVIAQTELADDLKSQFVINATNVSIRGADIHNAKITNAKITNSIQSDKFEVGVQGWRLNAETGALEIYGPHRN